MKAWESSIEISEVFCMLFLGTSLSYVPFLVSYNTSISYVLFGLSFSLHCYIYDNRSLSYFTAANN